MRGRGLEIVCWNFYCTFDLSLFVAGLFVADALGQLARVGRRMLRKCATRATENTSAAR